MSVGSRGLADESKRPNPLSDHGESPSSTEAYDVEKVREQFPILKRTVHGKPLAYLDNAATTQKPNSVLSAIQDYYSESNANVHRGVHRLSQEATELFEGSRESVRRLLGAKDTREIVFVRGATEGINLVAQCFARPRLQPGDEVLVSTMEHHSNIVPWQIVCEATGARLRVIPISDEGEISIEEFEACLSPRTKLVAVVHLSNALGTINPVKEMIERAHARGIPLLLDSAQALSHQRVDVQGLDCDFLVLSGHKMYAPTGIGALYGKAEHLELMPPYQGGGDMIRSVSFDGTTYNSIPHKFEAGTPNISGSIGLGKAAEFLMELGLDKIADYEREVLDYGTAVLQEIPGLRLIGTARNKASVLSFVLDKIHPHDLGTIVDQEGVAIRTGHHCAQPIMERYGIPATARASLACYNTREEIDALAAALRKAIEVMT